jgi:hypothetical protein
LIRGSLRLFAIPHRKKRLTINMIGSRGVRCWDPLFVDLVSSAKTPLLHAGVNGEFT